ncbi:MAG: nucleotide 5'-monophosphate nucleosidase PpnN [Pseudomonadota bacterium]
MPGTVNYPTAITLRLNSLSALEIASLCDAEPSELFEQFRRCAFAVLSSEIQTADLDGVLGCDDRFAIELRQNRGSVDIHIEHPPAAAFVDGEMMRGIRENLIAVLRDVLFMQNELLTRTRFDLNDPAHITSAVYHMLRNAQILRTGPQPPLAVCWGGHSIGGVEYDYTKRVGYQLGLRGFDICTGCGPGAMKGPMKGATIGHAKQRNRTGRYLGVSEPGIIAAEPPNPIVNQLVILPDIEKRLEAFVRLGDAFIIFPGGAGTAEELLYVLGVLADPRNRDNPFPLILTGPAQAAAYFEALDAFVGATLGPTAQARYQIIIDDPREVARQARVGAERMQAARTDASDSPAFNWELDIDPEFQTPFEPTHDAMAGLNLHPDVPVHLLARDLRNAFSGIVAGNIKSSGLQAVKQHGPYQLYGNPSITSPLAALLEDFVQQGRMRREPGYVPCFEFVDTPLLSLASKR